MLFFKITCQDSTDIQEYYVNYAQLEYFYVEEKASKFNYKIHNKAETTTIEKVKKIEVVTIDHNGIIVENAIFVNDQA